MEESWNSWLPGFLIKTSYLERYTKVTRPIHDCMAICLQRKEIKMPTQTGTSKTSRRQVIEPKPGDKRYVRRNQEGKFKKEVDVGRSLSADRRQRSRTQVAKGQGDRGETR